MYLDKIFYYENGNINEVHFICDKCGKYIKVKYDKDIFSSINNDYCTIKNNSNIICQCGNICQNGLIESKKENKIIYQNHQSQLKNIPHCPTCNSTNVSKIGTGERVGSVAMLGLFSKKINKSFKCRNCGNTW